MFRGLAILAVILVHTSQKVDIGAGRLALLAAYGQMGVQLFFVASAFTLCNSWQAREAESQPLLNYAIRRFFRIAPLYYFGIVFFLLASVVERYASSGVLRAADAYTIPNVLANVFLVNGFVPSANNKIVPGGWSIGTEVAFYCLFPLLFIASRKLQSWPSTAAALLVAIAVSLLAVAGVRVIYGLPFFNNGFVYFNIATQLPVFAIGMAMFWLRDCWPVRARWINGSAFLLLTLVALLVFRRAQGNWFYAVSILSAVSFVFLFHCLLGNEMLSSRWLARVGQLSFSMYLFHSLFAHKLSAAMAPHLQQLLPGWLSLAVCYAVALAATIGVATLSERLLERRSIAAGRKLIRRLG